MKTGDKVNIIDKFLVRYLNKKGISVSGTIIKIDGGYHYIHPDNAESDCIFELYDNEICLQKLLRLGSKTRS